MSPWFWWTFAVLVGLVAIWVMQPLPPTPTIVEKAALRAPKSEIDYQLKRAMARMQQDMVDMVLYGYPLSQEKRMADTQRQVNKGYIVEFTSRYVGRGGGYMTAAATPQGSKEVIDRPYATKPEDAAVFVSLQAALDAVFARGFHVGAALVERRGPFGCDPFCCAYRENLAPRISIIEVAITPESTRDEIVPLCNADGYDAVLIEENYVDGRVPRSAKRYAIVGDVNPDVPGQPFNFTDDIAQATRFKGSREATLAIARRALFNGRAVDNMQLVGVRKVVTPGSFSFTKVVA